jgi:hypothetical protein
MRTKAKIALSAAFFLGFCGAVMANDNSGENHQDGGNETGPNPFMTFSSPARAFSSPAQAFIGGTAAFAMHPAPHRSVKHQTNK